MDREQFRKKFGLGKRSHEVKCSVCGKTMTVPTMYSEKVRNEVLHPFCATATILTSQWLIHYGWHVSTIEANPPHMYYCPDCFPKGTPEYHESPHADEWCKQAEEWMNNK